MRPNINKYQKDKWKAIKKAKPPVISNDSILGYSENSLYKSYSEPKNDDFINVYPYYPDKPVPLVGPNEYYEWQGRYYPSTYLKDRQSKPSINRMSTLKAKGLREGGKLDKDPKQLKEVTIYADTNNHRYRSYKDSLDLYNASNDLAIAARKFEDYYKSIMNAPDSLYNKPLIKEEKDKYIKLYNDAVGPEKILGFAYGTSNDEIKPIGNGSTVSAGWHTNFSNRIRNNKFIDSDIIDESSFIRINDWWSPEYKKPTGKGLPPRNIRIQPKSITNISNKPNIETRIPSQSIGAKRGDKIFFQYSLGGKNNYINYGEGKGRESLNNEEADKLYNEWNESGLMYRLGESGQSNYGGIKKFKGGGTTDDPPYTPTDQEMNNSSKTLDKSHFDWMNNWFTNSSTKNRAVKQGNKIALNNAVSNINSPNLKYYNYRHIHDKYIYPLKKFKKIEEITPHGGSLHYEEIANPNAGIESKMRSGLNKNAGTYNSKTNEVYVTSSNNNVPVHELTHASRLDSSQGDIFNKHLSTDELYKMDNWLLNNGYTSKNNLNNERYPRIMEWRQKTNISPDHIYNIDDVKSLKKDKPIFNDIPEDKLLKILNELVVKPNNIQSVRNGGKIMKTTLRINNRLNPPKMSIGGIISAVSGLYSMGQGIGQGMLDSNKNEYGLIDNNTSHANTMQANLVFDPVGHIANVFGTGGSWEDLGWWGGKKQAAADDRSLSRIKRSEANAEYQAKLQMGRVGAASYNQYGYPSKSLYRKGGRIGDPPCGTLSKQDAYWLAVNGSKENAGGDRKLWKYVYDELYKKPANPERIYGIEASPGQNIKQEFTTTNKYPKTKRPFGFSLSKIGLQSLGKSAMKYLNGIGVEDFAPIIPGAMPDRKVNFGNTNLKCGGKAKMKRASGGMIPVKLDNDEIVYDEYGNPAPIVTNSRIGMKAGGTHILGGKGGTDKVDAMLPPGAVVISDDNGEKDKLVKSFNKNPSKGTIKQFMNRAVAKQKGMANGGLTNPWDITPMSLSKVNTGYYRYGNSPTLNTNFNLGMSPNLSNYNMDTPMLSNKWIGGMSAPSLTTPTSDLATYNKELVKSNSPGSIGYQTQQPANPTVDQSKFKSFVSNPDTWQAVGTIGELGLGVANTISNVNAMNKLKKLKYPKYQQSRFIAQDPRYMRAFYNEQKGGLDQSSLNTMEYLRRNTSGSGLANNYAKLNADIIRGKSGLAGQESATIGDIMNQNARGRTEFSSQEAIRKMGYDAARLGHNIGLINTGVALNQNTINTLQGFTNNLKQSAYQSKQLDAMARQYGLPSRLSGETLDEYQKRVYRTLV